MRVLFAQCLLITLVVAGLHPITSGRKTPLSRKVIPSTVFTGNVVANTISTDSNLDGPQLSAVNSSSYEWWYFDVVSQDLKSEITIVFYTALASGFGLLPPSADVTIVGIDFLFPNGSTSSVELTATEAVITTVGQGSSGIYKDTGAQWQGASDLSSYIVSINSPRTGVVGTLKLKSVAPAHYGCGKAVAGQPMMVAPNIGWSNAIPDAVGDVEFQVNGEKLCFQGVGYHDHNWGSQPFQNNLVIEHWGHGRLGEYSIVWSNVIAPDGTDHRTVYVAAKNEIIFASCAPGSFDIQPTYTGGTATTGTQSGFALQVYLGEGKVLSLQATIAAVVSNAAPVHMRWTGSLVGHFTGGEVIHGGVSTFEQFNLTA